MTSEPYASARTVYWIVDNGASHAGRASIERLAGGWQNLRLVHLPIHASWLNQIEIYFSIVQRKVLTPTTSPIWRRWNGGCWASSAATSRPRHLSTGASPARTWTGCCTSWTNMSSSPGPHDHHARTYKPDH